MTRKTISERRIAGANKQIAELTQALHEAREYGAVLAEGIKDKDGLIKHLKGANNRLRVKLGEAEQAAKASNDTIGEMDEKLSQTVGVHEAEMRDSQNRVDYLYRQYSKSRTEVRELKDGLRGVTKDARSWKRGFFALVVITIVAQVVNYAFG
uniref:Uncharacterized protein n=1 Tax=Klebsiella phage vB-Kvc-Y10 TaxID=3236922 RepID=A0AB39CBZ8_9CAUD